MIVRGSGEVQEKFNLLLRLNNGGQMVVRCSGEGQVKVW